MKNRWVSRRAFVLLLLPYDIRVHSSVVRAADRRSAGPWLKSGCALGHFDPWAERSFSPRFSCPEIKIILASPKKYIPMPHGPRHVRCKRTISTAYTEKGPAAFHPAPHAPNSESFWRTPKNTSRFRRARPRHQNCSTRHVSRKRAIPTADTKKRPAPRFPL